MSPAIAPRSRNMQSEATGAAHQLRLGGSFSCSSSNPNDDWDKSPLLQSQDLTPNEEPHTQTNDTPRPPRRSLSKTIAIKGSRLSTPKLEALLSEIEVIQPLCRDEREAVRVEHKRRFAANDRTVESLKRKLASWNRKKMPTGDPLMPEDVRRAKQICQKMTERAEMGKLRGVR